MTQPKDMTDAEALAALDGIALVAAMYLNADYADTLMQVRAHIAAVMAVAETAQAHIDAIVADPDLTSEMCKTWAAYQAAIAAMRGTTA